MHTPPLPFPKQSKSYSLQPPSLAEITLNLHHPAAERVSAPPHGAVPWEAAACLLQITSLPSREKG